MASSDSDSDAGDVIFPGFGRPSKKMSRRRFNPIHVVVERQDFPVLGRQDGKNGIVKDLIGAPSRNFNDRIDRDHVTDSIRHDSVKMAGVPRSDGGLAYSDCEGNGFPSEEKLTPFHSLAAENGDRVREVFDSGAMEFGWYGNGAKRPRVSRLFYFLRSGYPGVEGDDESGSCVAPEGEGDEPESLRTQSRGKSAAVEGPTEESLWSDGALQALYGSRDDFYERLAMMKRALKSAGGRLYAKNQPIRSFLMLWGILHLVGRKR